MKKSFLISIIILLFSVNGNAQGFFTRSFAKIKLNSAGIEVNKDNFIKNYKEGDNDTAALLLKAGTGLNSRIDGNPVLLDACWNGKKNMVRHLINFGADCNSKGKSGKLKALTPLIVTALTGKDTLTNLLLSAGASPNLEGREKITPLIAASCKGKFENILEGGIVDASKITMEDSSYVTITKKLLKYGGNPNLAMQKGLTPLLISSGRGYSAIVSLLLNNGADPNKGTKSTTPLIAASSKGKIKIVKKLLDKGADPNLKGKYGVTPLIAAVLKPVGGGPYNDVVNVLINNNANLNDQEKKHEMTPLMIAAAQGNPNTVKILLNNGATHWVTNDKNMTALEIAYSAGHKEVINLLEQKQNNK